MKALSLITLCGVLTVSMGLLAGDPGTFGDSFGYGDIDGNNKLDDRDIALFGAFLQGKHTPRIDPEFNMDLNNDGHLSIADLVALGEIVAAFGDVSSPRLAFTYGDLNEDGVSDEKDVQALAVYLTDGTAFRAPLAAADIDENGTVSTRDLYAMIVKSRQG